MKAPFPWFGGKSRVAHLVWGAFGDVANYVEPFAGSLAVLLARPHAPRIETVNDLDCYLANFWRATQLAPTEVAKWADWPVNEIDLHARHRWLVAQAEFRERMRADPEYFDARVAGWWVWGICQWIGARWCATTPGDEASNWQQVPLLKSAAGIHTKHLSEQMPMLRGDSGAAGAGIHASGLVRNQLPDLGGNGGNGGNGGAAGKGVHASAKSGEMILQWMERLSQRLRRVRVCCGDWTRIMGRSATELIGTTAVFLDPPYLAEVRDPSLYGTESADVARSVREWAIANGDNPKLRIALCGYEGEHDMPPTWQRVAWKAAGGYAASAGNNENSHKERVWFSPHCARAEDQASLFGGAA